MFHTALELPGKRNLGKSCPSAIRGLPERILLDVGFVYALEGQLDEVVI